EFLGIELVELRSKGAGIGRFRGGEAADLLEAGQVVEEGLHDAGDRSFPQGAPDANVAIGLIVDGDGDVAHVGSWKASSAYKSILGRRSVIIGRTLGG